jgi:hypothetical protein
MNRIKAFLKWLFAYQPHGWEAVCSVCNEDLVMTVQWGDKVGTYFEVGPCPSCMKREREAGYEQCKEEL